VTVIGGVIFLIIAGAFYAVIVRALIIIYEQVLGLLGKGEEFPSLRKGWYSIYKLRDYAVLENIHPAYSKYQHLNDQLQEKQFLDICCMSVVILVPLNWLFSSESAISLTVYILSAFDRVNDLVTKVIFLITFFFMVGVSVVAFRRDRIRDHYDYNSDVAKTLEKWCDEKWKEEHGDWKSPNTGLNCD
jgi:hypothetical protein